MAQLVWRAENWFVLPHFGKYNGFFCPSRTNVASVGSVFNNTRKVKVLSLPETIQEKIDVSSEGPSSGVSSGGQGKTTHVFIRGNTKTSRDKIKANQMDFIKTK